MKIQIVYLTAPYMAGAKEVECNNYTIDSANNLIIRLPNDKKYIINDRHWAAIVEL